MEILSYMVAIWSAGYADANFNLENFHNCLLDRVLLTLLGVPRCWSLSGGKKNKKRMRRHLWDSNPVIDC
jgi:hypothetical protein